MNRKGITLLEALFAIFVAAIGVLSLAALLPVGSYMIRKAEESDRGAAVALSAMGEFQVRIGASLATGPDAVAVDPWFLSREPGAIKFPFDSSNYYGTTTPIRIDRSTPFTDVFIPSDANAMQVHRNLSDRIFTSADDLVFTEPDGGGRPQAVGGNSSKGDYSWLAIVTPALSQRTTDHTMFDVSIVVFNKRAQSALNGNNLPTERIVTCTFTGSGLGGGDVRFSCPKGSNKDVLKLRPNQWIALLGARTSGGAALSLAGITGKNRPVIQWYRVVATGDAVVDTNLDLLVREATLAGPDWNIDQTTAAKFDFDADNDDLGLADKTYDADPSTSGVQVDACIMDGCITVLERHNITPQQAY